MKVLVLGSLSWTNRELIYQELKDLPKDTIVIEGESRGADRLGQQVAMELGLKVWPFYCNSRDGRDGHAIRDKRMFDEGNPDLVLIFHNTVEKSIGSKVQLKRAIDRKIPYKLIVEPNFSDTRL
jgi:hypothetical protein